MFLSAIGCDGFLVHVTVFFIVIHGKFRESQAIFI